MLVRDLFRSLVDRPPHSGHDIGRLDEDEVGSSPQRYVAVCRSHAAESSRIPCFSEVGDDRLRDSPACSPALISHDYGLHTFRRRPNRLEWERVEPAQIEDLRVHSMLAVQDGLRLQAHAETVRIANEQHLGFP